MTNVANLNTSALTVGQSLPVSWASAQTAPRSGQESYPPDHIVVFNESGCGFILTMLPSQRNFTVPAGAWSDPIEVTTNRGQDQSANLVVQYILAPQNPANVFVDYFSPGESIPSFRALGNSPVTLNGAPSLASVTAPIFNVTSVPAGDTWSLSANLGQLFLSEAAHGQTFTFSIAGAFAAPGALSGGAGGFTTDASGNITNVGGLATAGTIGVPIDVQTPATVHVTATTLTTILSFTPVTNATYRLTWSLDMAGAGGATCTLTVAYTDVRGIARTVTARTADGNVSVTAAALAVNDYPLIPVMLMNVQNTSNIIVSYQNSTGTPNDRIQAFVERLT